MSHHQWPGRIARAGAALLLLIASAASAQSVHVVGMAPGPGVDHTDVQAAIDAAAPGDVVLLLPGAYDGHVVAGKELVLVGVPATDGSPPLLAGIYNGGKAYGEHLALRGIRLVSALPGEALAGPALSPAGFEGVTYVEDCVTPPGEHGHYVDAGGADRLIMVRSAFTGRNGSGNGQLGGGVLPVPALQTFFTKAALYECSFVGGRGAKAFVGQLVSNPAQPGSTGAVFGAGSFSWTYLSEVSALGGTGGHGNLSTGGACVSPADGGTGASVGNPLVMLDSSFHGGESGTPEAGCASASAGADLMLEPGGSVQAPGTASRRLRVPTPIEPGDTFTLRYEGLPDELVLLLVHREPKPLWIPSIQSVLALPLDARVYTMGTMGTTAADGVLELTLTLPADLLPTSGGTEALAIFLQAVGKPTGASAALSNPTLMVVLDVP